ncbi:GNAT family N-acetyltransferase [Patescibacteria group bacterium]|nr:GNAT family N-acetyltransferase [Patescibacteria group bacterium]
MKNNLFLQNYQHLQYGIMYNKLVDLGFTSIAWCEKYDSSFFNHAQVDSLLSKDSLNKIETTLRNLERKPAVYFENRQNLSGLVDFLTQQSYKKNWEDSWMFHSGQYLNEDLFNQVRKVGNETSLEEFLKTFDACYQKDDPQNPYGELGDYLDVAKDAWNKHSKSGKIEYFTIYDGKKPVAVSTLTNFAGIGYISNVGSLKGVRGKGFGKIASLYCVKQSVDNGNSEHALATEEGHYPNEFYKRIGFKARFTALGYVKEEK